MGRKKKPFYRIVVMDSRKKRDGEYIEKVGYYNPMVNPADILIDEEIAMKWLNQGAIPSDTVKNLLSRQGIILKFDLKKKGVAAEKIEEEMKKWDLLQLERQKRLDSLKVQKQQEKKQAKKQEEKPPEPVAEVAAE
jgi:small subunit ribosomal protein S16